MCLCHSRDAPLVQHWTVTRRITMRRDEVPLAAPGAGSDGGRGSSGGPPSKAGRAPAPAPKKTVGVGRERLVRDLMTEKVFTLKLKDDLTTLYDLMDSRRVRHVPIVDSDGELVGLVTDRDLSRSALGAVEQLPLSVERDILRRRRIRDIMATEPDTIEPDASLREAAEM